MNYKTEYDRLIKNLNTVKDLTNKIVLNTSSSVVAIAIKSEYDEKGYNVTLEQCATDLKTIRIVLTKQRGIDA